MSSLQTQTVGPKALHDHNTEAPKCGGAARQKAHAMDHTRTQPASSPPARWLAWLALLGFPLSLWLFWVGFLGSDDAIYWADSSAWLAHFPYVGNTHWSLRHTLVLPIVLARLVFGDTMLALTVPCLLYATAALLVLRAWLARATDPYATAAAMALLACNPLLVVWSSTAAIDIVEIFFIFAGLALYARAVARGPSWGILLASGVLFGLAYLSRETAAFAVAAIGLLFLAGFGLPRRWYFVIAAGFAGLLLAEMVFLWAYTGNPLHRLAIAAHHDTTINRWEPNPNLAFTLHPLLDPVLMWFTGHYFSLLGWIGLPLAVWLLWLGGLAGKARQAAIILATVGGTWTVIASALWTQLPLTPRYFLLPTLCLSIVAALALRHLWQRGAHRTALALLALLLAGNLTALALENKNYRYSEWALADLAATTPGVLHADAEIRYRATLLLRWRGVEAQVVDTPPQHGDLYVYDPTTHGPKPAASWTLLRRQTPPPTWVQRMLSPLASLLPAVVWDKLGPRHPGIALYRVD